MGWQPLLSPTTGNGHNNGCCAVTIASVVLHDDGRSLTSRLLASASPVEVNQKDVPTSKQQALSSPSANPQLFCLMIYGILFVKPVFV